MENEEKKELVAGKTKIGEKTGRFGNTPAILTVYYGNFAMPPINGEYVHLQREKYKEMLEEFLSSPEGQQYRRPTEEENRKVETDIIYYQLEAKRKKEETLKNLQSEEQKIADDAGEKKNEVVEEAGKEETPSSAKEPKEKKSLFGNKKKAVKEKKPDLEEERDEDPRYPMDRRTKMYRRLCYILAGMTVVLSMIVGLLMFYIVAMGLR